MRSRTVPASHSSCALPVITAFGSALGRACDPGQCPLDMLPAHSLSSQPSDRIKAACVIQGSPCLTCCLCIFITAVGSGKCSTCDPRQCLHQMLLAHFLSSQPSDHMKDSLPSQPSNGVKAAPAIQGSACFTFYLCIPCDRSRRMGRRQHMRYRAVPTSHTACAFPFITAIGSGDGSVCDPGQCLLHMLSASFLSSQPSVG